MVQVAAPGEPEIVNASAPESSGAAAGPLEELIIDEVPAITNPEITITPVPGPAESPSPSAQDFQAVDDVISPAGEKEEPSEDASSEVLEAASPLEESLGRAPEEAVGPESAAAPYSQANTEEEAVGIPEDAPALQPGPEGAEEEAAAQPSEDIQAPKDIAEGAPEAATSESKEESPPSPTESEELPKTGQFGESEGIAPSEEGPISAEEVTAEESEEAGSESPGPSAEAVEENWEEVKVSEGEKPLEEDDGAASPSEAKPEASEGTLESEAEEMLNHEIQEIVVKVIFEAPWDSRDCGKGDIWGAGSWNPGTSQTVIW